MALDLDRRHLLAGLGVAAIGVTAAVTLPATSAPAKPESAEPAAADGPLIGPATDGRLHVMAFTIRLERVSDTESGNPDHWPDRRPILIDLLEREQPTVLGVQECKFDQLSAIRGPAGPRLRRLRASRGAARTSTPRCSTTPPASSCSPGTSSGSPTPPT